MLLLLCALLARLGEARAGWRTVVPPGVRLAPITGAKYYLR